jgi:hypothetical protein
VGSFLALLTLSVILNVTLQAAAFYCTCNSTSGAEELTTNSGPTLLGLLTGQFGRPKSHNSVHTLDNTSFSPISDVITEPDLSATYFHDLKAVSQHHPAEEEDSPGAEDADTR